MCDREGRIFDLLIRCVVVEAHVLSLPIHIVCLLPPKVHADVCVSKTHTCPAIDGHVCWWKRDPLYKPDIHFRDGTEDRISAYSLTVFVCEQGRVICGSFWVLKISFFHVGLYNFLLRTI